MKTNSKPSNFLLQKLLKPCLLFVFMSNVHLFVIKDDCLYVFDGHYRAIKRILENGVEKALPKLKPRFVDAGYIVVDLNKKKIVNGQEAFTLPLVKKGFEVLYL